MVFCFILVGFFVCGVLFWLVGVFVVVLWGLGGFFGGRQERFFFFLCIFL